MPEEWRAIPSWPYEASSWGRVRRATPGRGTFIGRTLNASNDRFGRPQVCLCNQGVRKVHFVHALVLTAFAGPPPSVRHEVNHKNGIKDDNRIENLEWVTRSENVLHSYRILGRGGGRCYGESNGYAKLSETDVAAIRSASEQGIPVKEIARRFGIHRGHVWRIMQGKRRAWVALAPQEERR